MKDIVLDKMIEYFGTDIRRISHALKVYGFALAIAQGEGLDTGLTEILKSAAALHDIGIHEAERKYNSTAGNYQELEGPPIARSILSQLGAEPAFIDRVCFLVGHHHSYSKIDGPDFQALIEADFIVNINEDGLSKEAASAARNKYFRTKTGTDIISRIYEL